MVHRNLNGCTKKHNGSTIPTAQCTSNAQHSTITIGQSNSQSPVTSSLQENWSHCLNIHTGRNCREAPLILLQGCSRRGIIRPNGKGIISTNNGRLMSGGLQTTICLAVSQSLWALKSIESRVERFSMEGASILGQIRHNSKQIHHLLWRKTLSLLSLMYCTIDRSPLFHHLPWILLPWMHISRRSVCKEKNVKAPYISCEHNQSRYIS